MNSTVFIRSFSIWIFSGFFIHFLTYNIAFETLDNEYSLSSGIFITFIFLLFFILIFFLLSPFFKFRWKPFFISNSFKAPLSFFAILLSLFYLFLSIDFYVNYGIGFRQSSEYSSSNTALMLLTIKQFVIVMIFSLIGHSLHDYKLSLFSRFIFLILTIASYLSLDSSMGVVLVLICLLFTFLPSRLYEKLVTMKITFLLGSAVLISFFLLAFIIVYVGLIQKNIDIIKIGLSDQSLFSLLYDLLSVRISSSFISLHNIVNSSLMDFDLNLRVIDETITLFQLRLEKLLPTGIINIDNNWVGGINRINYELNYTINELNYLYRAGASPSLFASFLYLPFFPFNIILMFGYILFVSTTYNSYFPRKNFNIFVPIGGIYFLYLFFESPLFLFTIGDYPILFILFVVLSMLKFENVKKYY